MGFFYSPCVSCVWWVKCKIQGLRQLTEKEEKLFFVFVLWFVFKFSYCLFQQLKGKKPPVASNGVMGKGKIPSNQQKKVDSVAGVKRTSSSKFKVQLRGKFQVWFAEVGP